MSMELSGYGANEPGAFNESVYTRAYNSLLSGLILTELDQIRESANALSESGFPLADELEDETYALENLLLEGATWQYSVQLEEVVETTIQSYAYSGLPMDRGVVLMACDYFDVGKIKLRQILEPGLVLGLLADEEFSRDEKAVLRYYGKRAMRQLGVGSWVIKFVAARLDRD